MFIDHGLFSCSDKTLKYLRRSVARNIWGQGRFVKIRAQMFYSSERLNYIETLPRASLKNNNLYQK